MASVVPAGSAPLRRINGTLAEVPRVGQLNGLQPTGDRAGREREQAREVALVRAIETPEDSKPLRRQLTCALLGPGW